MGLKAAKQQPRTFEPLLLAGLVLLGAAYHWAAFMEFSHSPFFGNPILDARYQIEWAFDLVAGREPHPVFFQAPLYSYLAAGWLALFGWTLWPQIAAQWLLVMSALTLFYLLLVHFSVRPWLRLILCAFALFYPLFPFYAAFFHKTSLEVFLHVATLYSGVMLLKAEQSEGRRCRLALIFGLVCGFSSLVRATFEAFIILICILTPKPRLRLTALILAGFALPFGWAAWHNYSAGGVLENSSTSFGFTLYLANNPANYEGVIQLVPGISNNPLKEEETSRAFAEKQSGRSLTSREVNSFFINEVLKFLRSDPLRFLLMLKNRFYWYVHREELPDNECYRCLANDISWLKHNPLNWGWFAVIVLPAVLSTAAGWLRRGAMPRDELFAFLFPLLLFGTLMIFYVSSRLRVGHVLPWLLVIGIGFNYSAGLLRSLTTGRGTLIYTVFVCSFFPGLHMALEKSLRYPPDMQTLRLCWIYNDLKRFDDAARSALLLKDPKKKVLMLQKIAALRRSDPKNSPPPHLLSQLIPHRGSND